MKTNPVTKTIAALLILASFAMVFLGWLDAVVYKISFYEYLKMAIDAGLPNSNAVLLLVVGILLAVAAILGLIFAIKGKKVGPIVYLVAALIALAFFLYASSETGAGLAIGAWLCPILALGAVVCMFIPEKN